MNMCVTCIYSYVQYFDAIPVDDERLFDLSLKASLPTPYQVLTEYMKRSASRSHAYDTQFLF